MLLAAENSLSSLSQGAYLTLTERAFALHRMEVNMSSSVEQLVERQVLLWHARRRSLEARLRSQTPTSEQDPPPESQVRLRVPEPDVLEQAEYPPEYSVDLEGEESA